MVQDFDIRSFLSNIKATKPPYMCPFDSCRKIYKTYSGMKAHLYQFDHVNNKMLTAGETPEAARKRSAWNKSISGDRSPSPPDFLKSSKEHVLTYAEAQRLVEVDIDGKLHRININEPLDIILLDKMDADSALLNGSVTSLNNSVSVSESNAKNKKGAEPPMTPSSGKNMKAGKGKNRSGKSGKGGKTGKGRKDVQTKNAQSEKPNTPLVLKLPEPSFRIIEGYDPPNAKQRSSSYYRYIEKTIDDIEEDVEYDMDEEDTAWLELINKQRKEGRLPAVPADTFELLMDRLEKESYFQSQNSGKDVGPAIDEDAVCCICNDGECQNSNAILFCDMCNLAVHQECYGVPYIPEGQWLCRRCLQSPSRAVDCVLCPNKGGAFKQTDDNRWAHVVCALWIPEVCFANTVFLEPIDSIGNIPSARWKLSCYICKQKNSGACIQCHKANCYVAFHVTCAQQAGLYMKMEAVKELTTSGVVTNVKKAAYCDAHTPTDENGTVLSGVYSSGEEDSRSDNQKVKQTKAKFKEKMKKARKILAEKRTAIPAVSIPTIPMERLTKIAALITIPKRNQFLQRLLGYWTLKRQSRNGVPLLRRLQISHNSIRKEPPKDGDNEQVAKVKEQFKCLNRLRQDLERVRLLVELIRKREKIKRERILVHQNMMELNMNPLKVFLLELIGKLEEKDTNQFFMEPVSAEEVPDYHDFIHNPMDFSTMRKKVNSNEYTSFDAFISDFKLMIANCKEYNEKETVYHKTAIKLNDQCEPLLREAKKQSEIYNLRTGLHLDASPYQLEMAPVTSSSAVPQVASELKQQQDKLKELEDELKNQKLKKSGGSRTKRVNSLTIEINQLQTKIKLLSDLGGHSFGAVVPVAPNPCLNTNATNSRNSSPNKKKQKSPKAKNHINDSDSMDIRENNNNLNNFIDKFEGRKTHNSVSATINSEIDELISSPTKQNSLKESPKRTKNDKSFNNIDNDTPKSKKSRSKKNKLNGGSPLSGTLSPISQKSCSSPARNSNFGCPEKTLRKKGQKVNSKSTTNSQQTDNMFTETAESFAREQAIRGTKRSNRNSSRPNKRQKTNSLRLDGPQNSNSFPLITQKESFSVYRNMTSPAASDGASESSQSHSSGTSSSTFDSSGSSRSHSSMSSMSSGTSSRVSGARNKRETRPKSRSSRSDISAIENTDKIPLEPNDLVWAKCTGFPWYPALIVNPDEDFSSNSVIPKPPQNVLQMREDSNNYLVSFFDHKRTWQWLPRNKLEPLSIDSQTDQQKLNESKKASDRKAVQKAYQKALEFFDRIPT